MSNLSATPETDRLNAMDVRHRVCLDFLVWLRIQCHVTTTLTNESIVLHYLGIDRRCIERERAVLAKRTMAVRRKRYNGRKDGAA